MHIHNFLPFLFLPLLAFSAETPPDNSAATTTQDPFDKPPAVPAVVLVGEGGTQKTDGSIRPWRTEFPTAFSGRYRLLGISDGHGWLDLKVTKTNSKVEPWRVEAKLVTEWGKDDAATLSFKGASLERDASAPIPYFEVSRRHLVGFFVEFTNRSDEKDQAAEKAIIIGPDVFVRDDNYKPRSYRQDVPAEKK
jgi:hypothetical protein